MTQPLSAVSALSAALVAGLFMVGGQRLAHAATTTALRSHDIVTQTRPESVDSYLEFFQSSHRVCAAAREMLQLPPPAPLVQVPPKFITQRTTYLSNGKAFLYRREEFFIDMSEMTPEQGCTTRLGSRMASEVVNGGKRQSSSSEMGARPEVEPAIDMETVPPPYRKGDDNFSSRRTIGGVAMRCAPASSQFLAETMQDLCILDLPSGTATDADGKPIVVHLRSKLLEKAGMVLLTEPVSVQIGQPVDERQLVITPSR